MATSSGKQRCVTCGKDKATMRCGGCLQEYCYNHLADHRQELNKQLDDVEVSRDVFRQTLSEQTTDPQNLTLIQEINDWERDSIRKIQQTAEEARQKLLQQTPKNIEQIEIRLNKLTKQLRQGREENDFHETDLRQWNTELIQLANELTKPFSINLRQGSTPLINNILVDTTLVSLCSTKISASARWIQNGVTVAGGNGSGNGVNQLYRPFGLYVDDDQTIYISDYLNHRIVEWKRDAKTGQVVAGGNGQGKRNDQLYYPTDVVVDRENDSLIISDYNNKRVVRWPRRNGTSGETIISNITCLGLTMDDRGYLYVSDFDKHEVRRWKIGDANQTVVAGGNGEGNRLDQLFHPRNIFVDQDHSVYISDSHNHRVMKWTVGAKEGIVVAGGQGQGKSLTQLSDPRGIVVDQLGTVYVADCSNHRVMRWVKGTTQGTIALGGNGQGGASNQFYAPIGLSSDRQGNFYVTDYNNHRVQKFNIDLSSTT